MQSDDINLILAAWVGLCWFISAFILADAAKRKGLGSASWFFVSLLMGPVIAALLLISTPPRPLAEAELVISKPAKGLNSER